LLRKNHTLPTPRQVPKSPTPHSITPLDSPSRTIRTTKKTYISMLPLGCVPYVHVKLKQNDKTLGLSIGAILL